MSNYTIAQYVIIAAVFFVLAILAVRAGARAWFSEKERHLNRFMKKLEKENE